MELKKNPIKQALRNGQTVFGLPMGVPSPVMVVPAACVGQLLKKSRVAIHSEVGP